MAASDTRHQVPNSVGAVPAELLADICLALRDEGRALALYGSRARGSERPDSDVDVLQLASGRPATYSAGRVNVSSYQVGTLRSMAAHGSLFVLHLTLDAVILSDPHGELQDVLDSYAPPVSYMNLLNEVRATACALWPVADSKEHLVALRKLGIYLVRTAAYALLASRGTPTFDTVTAGDLIDDDRVRRALMVRLRSVAGDDVSVLMEGIAALVGAPPPNPFGSVGALAVSYSDRHPYAAALLAHLLAGDDSNIEYTALTLPPL